MRINRKKLGLALTWMTLAALLLSVFGAVPARAATITVCASGCDHATIQAAINAATAGDTINVADGTYTITSPIDVNKGVTITGNVNHPENVVVQYSPASTTQAIFDMNAANITVQGIKAKDGKNGFLWGKTDTTYTGCTVTNCIVDGASSFAIGEIPATNTTISDNTITTCGGKGIYIRECAANNTAERAEVTGNTISGCSATCIQVYKSPYTYVYDNTISSTGDKGIYIFGPNAASQAERVIVEGNTISGCPYPAIQVIDDRYTYIYNNTIGPTNDKGINVIKSGATSTTDRVQVIGNTISETKWPGIQVIGAPYTYVYNNTLTKCNYYGGDGTGDWDYASIHVEDDGAVDGSNVTVDSNTISDGINGVQIWSDNCTVTDNTIYNMGLTYADTKGTGDGTYYNSGIIIGTNWLTGNFKPTGTTITGNSIYDNYWGLYVRDYATLSPGDPITLSVTAENTWWGDATGPNDPSGSDEASPGTCFDPSTMSNTDGTGDSVSDLYVDYCPWLTGVAPGTLQAVINAASPGDVIQLGPYTYEGGITINKSVTILGHDGTVIHAGSPAYTVTADGVTIDNVTMDGAITGTMDSAVVVNAGVSDLWIRNCEIKNWGVDGIHFNGAITGLKIVDNHIHDNGGDGIEFNGTPGGTVQIYGNAFRSNTGYGINVVSPSSVSATYNEWGHVGGPTSSPSPSDDPRDAASSGVTYTPWVFGKLYVDPATQDVRETEQATVYIKMDVHHLYGIQFTVTFSNTLLQLNATPTIGSFNTGTTGSVCTVTDQATANSSGSISFHCTHAGGDAEYDATGDTILTLVFDAQNIPGTDATSAIDIDADSVVLGAKGGVNIFVDSVTDGDVKILGTTMIDGVVDLQGRDDDSGAEVDPQAGTLHGYDPAADTTDVWGRYEFADMTDDTYTINIEMERYLNASASVVVSGDTKTLTPLVLMGGDVNNNGAGDGVIDVSDATPIGSAFGTVPGDTHWNVNVDINADNEIDILDLVIMGGNYGQTSASAYATWSP